MCHTLTLGQKAHRCLECIQRADGHRGHGLGRQGPKRSLRGLWVYSDSEENQWRFESWVGHSQVHLLQEVPLPPNMGSVAFLGALRVPSSLSNLTSQ